MSDVADFLGLFDKQYLLDSRIRERWGKVEGELEKKLNAYLVELGEFLNEVRAFKFWSVKRMDSDKAREEYIDGLHFLLSIGNDLDYSKSCEEMEKELNKILELNKNQLYNEEVEENKQLFVKDSLGLYFHAGDALGTKTEYVHYFMRYVEVGMNLGISLSDMVLEYDRKNKENYERQDNGY